jgi:hypothetical protein
MAAYFLPLVLAPGTCMEALRSQLLFNTVLNVASGDTTFGVAAGTHRPYPRLGARLSWMPQQLRLVVWLLSMGATCLLLLIN